jgi:hypothetical protein
MITTADFLGYIVLSMILSYLIGFIINGIFSFIPR